MTNPRFIWLILPLVISSGSKVLAESECQPYLNLFANQGYTLTSQGIAPCTVELTMYDEQQKKLLCTEILKTCDTGEADEQTRVKIQEFQAKEIAAEAAFREIEERGKAMMEEKARRVAERLRSSPPPLNNYQRVLTENGEHQLVVTVAEGADFEDIELDVISGNGRLDEKRSIPEFRVIVLSVPAIYSEALFEKLQKSKDVESVSFNTYTSFH